MPSLQPIPRQQDQQGIYYNKAFALRDCCWFVLRRTPYDDLKYVLELIDIISMLDLICMYWEETRYITKENINWLERHISSPLNY